MLKPLFYTWANGEKAIAADSANYIGGQIAAIGSDGKVKLYNGEGTPLGLFWNNSVVDKGIGKATILPYGTVCDIIPENGVAPYAGEFNEIAIGSTLYAGSNGKLTATSGNGTPALALVIGKDEATKGIQIVVIQPAPAANPEPATTYTVTASVEGGNGSVSPESVEVEEGGDAEFTLTPAAGYQLNAITVNGEAVTEGIEGNKFTLSGVDADATVVVTFKVEG